MLPNLSEEQSAQIDQEIDGQAIQTAEEKQAALLKATAARFGQSPEPSDPEDPDAPKGDDEEEGAAA
jgi:hypothetical protein